MAKSPGAAISLRAFKKGCEAYWKREPRDAMYRIAARVVKDSWGNAGDTADGLGVILLTWNQAAYRYGIFDFVALEDFLKSHRGTLEHYRGRSIKSFNSNHDAEKIKALFAEALAALKSTRDGRKSPVAVAKTLHIIAPRFFPLWDGAIARGRSCRWYRSSAAASKYIAFMNDSQTIATSLEARYKQKQGKAGLPEARNLAAALSKQCGRSKTILKFLDEYFFAKYTGRWI